MEARASGRPIVDSLDVFIYDGRWHLAPGQELTFGRGDVDGIIGLDRTDRGISHTAGAFRFDGNWILHNMSKSRPLLIEHARVVRHTTVPPASTIAINSDCRVLVPGKNFTHPIDLTVAKPAGAPAAPAGVGYTETDSVVLTGEELIAVAAVSASYLARFPRHHPHPLSYGTAAVTIGVSEAALRRRIDRLRERLAAEGHPVTDGPNAVRDLIDLLIGNQALTVEHLDLVAANPSDEPGRP